MTFVESFEKLCDSVGKAPTRVCVEIGLSDAIYSSWQKNNTLSPRKSTLRKLAEYFNVSEDVVLGKRDDESVNRTDKELIDILLTNFTQLSTRSKLEIISLCEEKLAREQQYAHA